MVCLIADCISTFVLKLIALRGPVPAQIRLLELVAILLLFGGDSTPAMAISEGCGKANEIADKAENALNRCLADQPLWELTLTLGGVCEPLRVALNQANNQADFTCKQDDENRPSLTAPITDGTTAPKHFGPSSITK